MGATNVYVRPQALNMETKYVKPMTSAFIKNGAGSYVPKVAPIAKPIVARTGLAGLYDNVAGYGSKLAGKLSTGAGLLFAPTEVGVGSDVPVSTGYWNETNTTPAPKVVDKNTPPPVVKQTPAVQDTSKTIGGKTNKSKVGQLMAPPPMVPATKNTAIPTSSVGQVVGDTPYQMSNLPIGSGVNQDLYGVEFNDANRYAGYGEASTGGNVVPPPVTGNAQDTFWENLNRSGGYSAQEWNAMTPEQRIQAGAQKSNLASGMEQFGQLASGASALAGIYGTMQNAKYLKDQTKMQKNMIRSDDANKSQFAKAAGGTYTKTGV